MEKFSTGLFNVTGSGYISETVNNGIISGFTDGTYRPNEPRFVLKETRKRLITVRMLFMNIR